MQPDIDPRWRQRAACRRVDPETMYPTEKSQAAIGQAKAICARCPVQLECRTWAITIRDGWGVWGGLTPLERARHRSGQPVQTCNTCRQSFVDRKKTRCPNCRSHPSRSNANVAEHRDDIQAWAAEGWTDRQIAAALGCSKEGVRSARHRWDIAAGIAPSNRRYKPCGTEAAKRRHGRRNDPPCTVCRWAGTPQPSAASAA